MSVDTKAVVITDEKDFWKVSQRIGHALYQIIRPNYEAFSLKEKMQGTSEWKLPKIDVSGSFFSLDHEPTEYFKFIFTYNGEQRMMSVHTDCDCDLQNVHGFGEDTKGVIMSLGHWGSSVEIMEKVLEGLKDMGKCYILEMDCDDDWRGI